MPTEAYAHGGLCPMHVGYLMLLRKAIVTIRYTLAIVASACVVVISGPLASYLAQVRGNSSADVGMIV
jgi:hypothetical protein